MKNQEYINNLLKEFPEFYESENYKNIEFKDLPYSVYAEFRIWLLSDSKIENNNISSKLIFFLNSSFKRNDIEEINLIDIELFESIGPNKIFIDKIILNRGLDKSIKKVFRSHISVLDKLRLFFKY
jgi:hypothetical protein